MLGGFGVDGPSSQNENELKKGRNKNKVGREEKRTAEGNQNHGD